MSPPQTKRVKIDLEDLCNQAFAHYRSYLDSLDEDEHEGDIDELQELIEIAAPQVKYTKSKWNSLIDLLPILLSMACNILAEGAISNYLASQASDGDVPQDYDAKQIQELLTKSLAFFPENASTWSMGANFGRMTHRLSIRNTREWYERAVQCANKLRHEALAVVNDDTIEDMVLKEWVELLVLNEMLGIEYEGPENEEDGDLDDAAQVDEDGEEYSPSAVESTARFMAAMLCSMVDHKAALLHLEKFHLSHRLHPNVWSVPGGLPSEAATKAPLMFRPKSGIVPEALFESMKQTFAPKAAYWKESNYSNRGYYSYFTDYETGQKPRNVIEEVIINHILPRACQSLDEPDSAAICGFEWWIHTRPIQANLGHNLHFDTDESLLAQEGKVTHPVLSSVLYLSGGDDEHPAGTTVILDQTPDSEVVAESAWLGVPKDNSLILFPGNLLHGVLPCPGDRRNEESTTLGDLAHCWEDPPKDDPAHRLTFMVGFWTRNVPANMKERHLYGPCGPLPPATDEHTWVGDISKDYGDEGSDVARVVAEKTMGAVALPRVSPAWDLIERKPSTDSESESDPPLQIPHGIDHRFFVFGAPQCFRDSLFEDQECG